MSKQKTLFQSWGGQTSHVINEQPSTSRESNGDVIDLCDSLEDGDDELLCEAEAEFSTDGLPLQDEADNPTNISIGADGFTPTQAQSQNTTCPGFDRSAGKLSIYPTNYPVRDYQFNIVNKSLFKNTMVTLPTGLGKTFIAAVVMYNFYRWYPQGKVIFMAPTKPLVAQQIEACYNIMGIPQDHTAEMTGSMGPPKREKSWHEKRVFFLTPQVLTNDLSRGSCPAEFVKCLVIDEAHKALGNHAYCQVVRELVKYTEQFRVLALSATPGSDIKAVQQVLSNLLISHIEIRTEESIDIKQYSHERVVDKVVVPLGDELTKVKTKYIHIMDMIVNKLKRHGVLYNREATSLSKFLILKAREAFRQNPPERLQRNQFGIVEGDFALAMSLYHGYELLQLHGSRSLFNYLEGIVSGDKGYGRTKAELSRNGDFNDLIDLLRQKYTVPQDQTLSQAEAVPFVIGHPKMEKLQEIVLEHFRKFEANNAQTRVMIFSQYRDSVQEIRNMLNRHRPLVKVMSFIGQSSAGKSTKGFTQKEQLLVMKQFREGGYNTLVSTCVGEEGLDIGDVDLIICFDAHKSPIRLVQRMGRTGRKREGRIVMLVTQGKEEQIYNQSQYSKKSIHKAILNGAKSLHFYQHSPRMLPESVTPTVHRMHITISGNFKPTKKITTETKTDKTTKISNHLNKEKQDLCDGLITREEYEELQPWLVPEEEIPKLPPSDIVHLSKDDGDVEEAIVARGSFLSLSEWTPWQNTLQETSDFMDHSMQSKHLVQLMEFIQLQNILDPEDDPYGLEMAAYFNEEDVLKPNDKDGTISRFCLLKQNEGEGKNNQLPNQKKIKRHSEMLPAFDVDPSKSEEESEDELPAFPFIQTKRPLHIDTDSDLPNIIEDGDLDSVEDKDCEINFNPNAAVQDRINIEDSTSNHSEDSLSRKVGRNDQRNFGKSNALLKSKAKVLDLKMKNNATTRKRRKVRTINRSVIELLKSTDDNDFDKTPPDNVKDNAHPVDLTNCVDEDDVNIPTKSDFDEPSQSGNDKQYVVRTPPTVEDAIKLCEAAELEGDKIKIDLLELIDEWDKETRDGKYLVLPCRHNKENLDDATYPYKARRKMSEPIKDIHLNTSCMANGVTNFTKDYQIMNAIDETTSTYTANDIFLADNADIENVNVDESSEKVMNNKVLCGDNDIGVDTHTDIELSGSFTVLDHSEHEQSPKGEITDNMTNCLDLEGGAEDRNKELTESFKSSKTLNSTNTELSCSLDVMDIETDSLLSEIDKNQKLLSHSKTIPSHSGKINKTQSKSLNKKAVVLASTWVSDDSDDELLEKIKTPSIAHNKEVISPILRPNTSTQFTFTQALDCVHSGNMTPESDLCNEPSQLKVQKQKLLANNNLNLQNNQLCDSSKPSAMAEEKREDFQESDTDLVDHLHLKMASPRETKSKCLLKSVIPKDTHTSRRLSTSSDESEQPQFDLGFDIDEDIIPPSPEMSQPFQVSGKSRLSQTFTARLSQNRFSSTLASKSCEISDTDYAANFKNISDSKTKIPLRLEDKFVTDPNILSPLEEEEESQSILDNAPNNKVQLNSNLQNKKDFQCRDNSIKSTDSSNKSTGSNISKPFDDSLENHAMNTNVESEGEQCLKNEDELISSKDAFESSFALLDDDFDEWIGGDLEDVAENSNTSNECKQPPSKITPSVRDFKNDNDRVDNQVVINSKKEKEVIASCSPHIKRKKKSILKSRKSVFCPADLSLEDSFCLEIKSDKTNISLMNTPDIKKPGESFKNTSTPVLVPTELSNKFRSPAVTPLNAKNITRLSNDIVDGLGQSDVTERESPIASDQDDSFVVRKKKRKPLCLESPKSQINEHSPDTHNISYKRNSLQKTSFQSDSVSNKSWGDDDDFDDSFLIKNNDYFKKKGTVLQIQSDSDDDFDRSSMIKNISSDKSERSMSEHKDSTSKATKKLKTNRNKNPKRSSNPFIDEEAGLSEEDDVNASSDESDHSDLDKYEGSFIQDTQFSQSQGLNQTDIQALYLKSVKSPVGVKGGFKLQYNYKDVDVFSQIPHEEESEYMEDSFCVGSEEDDWLAQEDYHGEITVCDNQSDILQSGKKRRRGVSNLQTGRQRQIHFGRMKALDEIRSKMAKKNKEPLVGGSSYRKSENIPIGKKNNLVSKMTRITIPEESSSDEDMNNQKEHSMVSPNLQINKKRKRVRLLSSSDDELQESKIVCTQQNRFSENKHVAVFDKSDTTSMNVPVTDRKHQMASASFSREERIQRQKLQQEQFKKTIERAIDTSEKNEYQSFSEHPVTMTKIKDRSLNIDGNTMKGFLCDKDDDMNLLLYPQSSRSDTLCILVDSKEISGGQDIISSLRFTHKVHVSAAQLPGCDYIVSNRMAVERKQWSDFSNGANRAKLIERIQHLGELYDRPCLIVEKDRVKAGEEKSERQIHWTKYIDSTCAMLLKSHVKILFTDTQIETASVLADLCQLEKRKGMNIPTPVEQMSKKTNMVKFYISFPKLNYVHALNLCYGFDSVSNFLNSSVAEIERKGKMSTNRATEVFNYIRRKFDTSMLPTKHR